MRIGLALYRDHPTSGGSFRVALNLCRSLPSADVETTLFVAYGQAGPISEHASHTHLLGASGPFDLAAWRRLRRGIHDSSIQLLHLVEPVAWITAASLGAVPRLGHVHGRPAVLLPEGASRVPLKTRLLDRAMARLCIGHIAISQDAKDGVRELRWQDPEKIWVVRNGVDLQSIEGGPPRDEALMALGLDPAHRYLGMVCRLVRHRGCSDAIRMLKSLPADWHLLLVGDGPMRSELLESARSSSLADRVHFLGWILDASMIYPAIDIYLFLASYESFGLSVAEAMATRTPVVGLSGHGEYQEGPVPLLSNETADLLPRSTPDDFDRPEELSVLQALAERVQDTSQQKVEEAHSRVVSYYTSERQAGETEAVYRALLELL